MTPRLWIAVLVCALAASTVAPTPARADDAKADKREAQRHFDAGKQLIKKKAFAEAIVELQRAYELDPRTEHLYNIAVAFHLKGDADGAMKFYRQFLDSSPSGKAARDAKRFLGQLEAAAAEREANLVAERAEAERIKAAEERRAEEARKVVVANARADEAERRAGELQRELDAVKVEVDTADRELAELTARRDDDRVLARRWEVDARRAPSAGGRGRRVVGTLLMSSGAAAVSYAVFDLLERTEGESLGRPILAGGTGAIVVGLGLYFWGESAVSSPRSKAVVERISVVPQLGRDSLAFALTTQF